MYYVVLHREAPRSCGGPHTVLTCRAAISPCSDDCTNTQRNQQLLIVNKYRWVPGGPSVSPCASLPCWTRLLGVRVRLPELCVASPAAGARPSADVRCGCFLRAGPVKVTLETTCASFPRVSAAKAGPLLPPGGEARNHRWLSMGRTRLGVHPAHPLEPGLVRLPEVTQQGTRSLAPSVPPDLQVRGDTVMPTHAGIQR